MELLAGKRLGLLHFAPHAFGKTDVSMEMIHIKCF